MYHNYCGIKIPAAGGILKGIRSSETYFFLLAIDWFHVIHVPGSHGSLKLKLVIFSAYILTVHMKHLTRQILVTIQTLVIILSK